MNTNNKMFRELIKDEFTTKIPSPNKRKKTNSLPPVKPANFSKLPPFQLPLGLQRKPWQSLSSMAKSLPTRVKSRLNLANYYMLKYHPRILATFSKSRRISPNYRTKKSKKSTRPSLTIKTNSNLGSI